MTAYQPPRTADLPPAAGPLGAVTPRCLGGCGAAVNGRVLVCTVCWRHLSNRLRRAVIAWSRNRDATSRANVILDVEAACALARRRAR